MEYAKRSVRQGRHNVTALSESASDESNDPPRQKPRKGRTEFDIAFLRRDPNAGKLLLVRHGQQIWPDEETSKVGEWHDPALSELGQAQAICVGEYLAEEPVAAIYSSALQRANHTAEAIAKHHGLDVNINEHLAEHRLFRDLPASSMASEHIDEAEYEQIRMKFTTTKQWDSYPHSEPSVEFRNRTRTAIDECIAGHPGETVVVACHGGVINAYLAEMLGLKCDMFYWPAHTSVHRVLFKEDSRVIGTLNEQNHLLERDLHSS